MANEHLFTAEAPEAEPKEERKKSFWSMCLGGCLVGVVVVAVLVAVALFWISRNWRELASNFGAQAIKQGIDQSQLPAQEKIDIKIQIDRVADAVRKGQLSGDQLHTLMQKLVESPLMTSFVAAAVEKQYFEKSGLSDEEKAEGKRTVRRFLRGTIDNKIDKQGFDAAMTHVADRDVGGNWKLRQQVSDDELRAFLAEAKARADAANIAEEPKDIDPSDEVKRIVDEALGEASRQPPAESDDSNNDAQAPAAQSLPVPSSAVSIASSSAGAAAMPGSSV
jgi:hypothetical protein